MSVLEAKTEAFSWRPLPSVGHAAKTVVTMELSAWPALLSGVSSVACSMMGFGELGRPSSQHVLDGTYNVAFELDRKHWT